MAKKTKSRAVVKYRKPKRRRSHKMTIPLAVVAGFVPPAVGLWNRRGSATEMSNYLLQGFTGMTPGTNTWNVNNLRLGLMPVVAGFIAHMVAGKLGVNRVLSRANIPLIRI